MNKEEKELLDIFASMHLICFEKLETPNEKISRYLLEKNGYIDKARIRLGGDYLFKNSVNMHYLKDYYHKNIIQ
jgi:hypothetical protein